MKTLTLNYGINETVSFKMSNDMINPSNQNNLFQWDYEERFKSNAMKEIQQALRMLKKKGTIDY